MAYMDEDIAKAFKQERLKRQAEMQAQLDKELEAQLDEEAIKQGILEGQCSIFDRTFSFSEYSVCDGRFTIQLPDEGIVIQHDDNTVFKSANEELGFSCNIVTTDEKAAFEPLSVYKENMMKNLRKVQFKWLEEGAQMVDGYKVMYLDFITLTGMVNIHQNMWFVMGPYGQTQIVVNYDHSEEKYWKPIIKAIRSTLLIHGE